MFSSSKIRRACWRRGAPAAYFVLLFLIAWLALAPVREARAAAVERSAPLEEIKSELKAMKRDKNPELGVPGTAPKISMPGLSLPEDASPTPPARDPQPPAAASRKDSSNWLLEGMELQADDRSKKTGSTNSADDYLRGKMPDLSDPAYFLKVYVAQIREKKEREANERRQTGESASSSTSNPGAGPFGEFLDRWISAKNKSLLGLDQPLSTAADGAPTGWPPAAPAGRNVAERTANPFIEAMKSWFPPASSTAGVPAARVPPAPAQRPGIVLPWLAAPAAADPPPEAPKPGPPSNPAADEKYFPQLSRF